MRARTGPWCGNDRAVLTGTLQNTNLHVDSSLLDLDLVVDRFTVADEVCIYPQERKVMSAQQEGPCVPVHVHVHFFALSILKLSPSLPVR
mgnify:CR=1 FL=1